MHMAIKYGKGGPTKRRRKGEEDVVPPRFDLGLVNHVDPVFLPGGLLRAFETAHRNRAHCFQGLTWILSGIRAQPGDWILRVDDDGYHTWWLVFSTTFDDAIVVNEHGGYIRLTKTRMDRTLLEVRPFPPWWEEWLERELEAELQ